MLSDGLELNSLGVTLYFVLVGVWSLIVAYIVTFAGSKSGHGGHGDTHGSLHGHAASESSHAFAPVEPTRAKPFRGFSPYEGFKSYAQGETVTVEDIVKGIARESGAASLHDAHAMHDEPKAHAHDPAKAASSAQANAFLDLLVQSERDDAHAMLRDIEEHGEGAEPFLKRVLTAVESALNARKNGGTCDLRTMEVLGNCETPALEKLAAALATADGDTQGGKLALTRALSALK